jgi:hypothetical protein
MGKTSKDSRLALRESLEKVYASAAEQGELMSYRRQKILFIKIIKL